MNGPHIWVPRCKIIEPRNEIALRCRLAGRFVRLAVIRPDGRIRTALGPFSNLILNQGLDFIGSGTGGMIGRCAVGTGQTAPAAEQTELDNQIAVTNTISTFNAGTDSESPYAMRKTVVYRFAQGAAAGNLTEVAVGAQSGSPMPCFSRELIRDEEGEPTTLTVLADEFLDVTYEIFVYPPLADVEEEAVSIGDGTHDLVIRAAQVGTRTGSAGGWGLATNVAGTLFVGGSPSSAAIAFNGSIGAITGAPSGTSGTSTDEENVGDYSNGDYYRDMLFEWGLSDGNLTGGISAIQFRSGGGAQSSAARQNFQCGFSPAIPKTDEQVLALTFRHSWSRV